MAATIIITLTNDTWVAAGGTFNAQRQGIIDGIDAAQSESQGWDAEVKANMGVAQVVRTSATVCTITLLAAEVADYRITSNEVLTCIIPAAALTTSSIAVTATPTITLTAAAESVAVTGTAGGDGSLETEITDGGQTVILTLTNTVWQASGSDFNDQRQAIIDGLDAAESETLGWNNEVRDEMAVGSVVRTSDTVVTITIAADDVDSYAIADDEVITVTVPKAALVYDVDLVGNQTFTITAEAPAFISTMIIF